MQEIFRIDLQLFAGEKTEPATPRRREEARKKGQVFRSTDLTSAFIILGVFAVINFTFPYMLDSLRSFTADYLTVGASPDFTPVTAYGMFLDSLDLFIKIILPVLGIATLAGLVSSLMQVGFIFSTEPLGIKLERINPFEGFKRIFSKRALVELVKSIFKLGLTAYIVYEVGMKHISLFSRLMDMEVPLILETLMAIVFEMAMKVGVALLVLGILDYLYQRWEHEQSLKMTKQEVKEEYKQVEGHPQIKARQKQKQRELAMRRMMAEVPKADVVITNPTHFAVALRYTADQMEAPMVVAKGQDFVAQRIRELARSSGVAIVENQELARNLFYICDLGEVIPENLYQAVAQVLAFVYRQKQTLSQRSS